MMQPSPQLQPRSHLHVFLWKPLKCIPFNSLNESNCSNAMYHLGISWEICIDKWVIHYSDRLFCAVWQPAYTSQWLNAAKIILLLYNTSVLSDLRGLFPWNFLLILRNPYLNAPGWCAREKRVRWHSNNALCPSLTFHPTLFPQVSPMVRPDIIVQQDVIIIRRGGGWIRLSSLSHTPSMVSHYHFSVFLGKQKCSSPAPSSSMKDKT